MIRINLLPVEMRRGNRLAARVIAAAFGAAIAVSASVGWFGIVYFGDYAAAGEALRDVETRLAEKEKRVAYHDRLEANKKDYAARVQTIQDIGKSRRIWSRFLDELIDVVNNNGDTERHLAWFDAVIVRSDPKGATVTLPTWVQDKEKDKIANFHEDLEASPFAHQLSNKSDPAYRVEKSETRTPPLSMTFPLVLQFNPPVADAPKPNAAAVPPAPANK